MEIFRVSAKEYKQQFPSANHVYNSVEFAELNRYKCLDVHYLLFKDSKVRFGLILGEKEKSLCSPFSAPFGGFAQNKNENIEYYESACEALREYSFSVGKDVCITLFPEIYDTSACAKTYLSLIRSGAKVQYTDINYYYELGDFSRYWDMLDSKSRNKLRNAMKNNFKFEKLNSKCDSDIERAYSVIKANRVARGFPLRMSLEDVKATAKVVNVDFFVCSLNDIDMAASQVYRVTDDICQVIYWGDIQEYANYRVMNYFAFKTFEYYSALGVKLLDIGPSSEQGKPNYGLCEYKENIGCKATVKLTLNLYGSK